jgi:hypothetical protein
MIIMISMSQFTYSSDEEWDGRAKESPSTIDYSSDDFKIQNLTQVTWISIEKKFNIEGSDG